MPNNLSAARQEFWQAAFQTLWKPMSIYGQVAEILSTEVKQGVKLHRPLPSDVNVQRITVGSDLTSQDLVLSDEFLDINQYIGTLIGVDRFDQMQTKSNYMKEYGKIMVRNVNNAVDSDVLYNAVNATSTLDDSSIGNGTAGVPLALNGTNIFDALARAKQYQFDNSFENTDMFCAIDSKTFQLFESNGIGRETMYGDQLWKDGFTGRAFQYNGIDFYETANHTRSIRLDLATAPTDGDTVTLTVGGVAVVFTFKGTLGTTAGNVLIGTADESRANLVALINAPGTTTANGVALSFTNQTVLLNVLATNDNTANTATIFSKGKSLVGTETLTNATDAFNATYNAKRLLFGRKSQSVSMGIQITPSVTFRDEPKQERTNVLVTTSYGTKMFTDGANTSVQLLIAA